MKKAITKKKKLQELSQTEEWIEKNRKFQQGNSNYKYENHFFFRNPLTWSFQVESNGMLRQMKMEYNDLFREGGGANFVVRGPF